MAFAIGIDFRATSVFVTDPAGCTNCLGDPYPTTRGGATFGWLGGVAPTRSNRSAAVDPRIAGVNTATNAAAPLSFQVDLPSPGNYTIDLGLGNSTASTTNLLFVLNDGANTLLTVGPATIAGAQILDALGNVWSAASWPTSKVPRTVTFAGTTLTFTLGSNPTFTTGSSVIAHLSITQVITPPSTSKRRFPNYILQRRAR